ncbi:hypothetical protein G9A89_006702 [Geosiphon pyriformis]|nr:hypothetical protein G9A89_006702 [Geosiphon pyriformis]
MALLPTVTTFKKKDQKPLVTFGALPQKQHSKNNFKSIYTHCKQRFNIPDGIEVIKKSVYQYIENCINNYLFGNYNISEVRSNLYNNLVHYLQLGTEDLNIQPKYSFNFESETETSNKNKQKVKQYSRTTPNTPILPKTTAKHLQTPEQETKDFQSPRNPTQQQKPISTSANIIDYLQENESNHLKSLESEKTEPESEEATENEEEIVTAYIAKIPEFTDQFIARLKDKLIKKVHSHAPTDLATVIRHAKNYEIAIKEANHTKLVNLAIEETSLAAEEKINQLTKKDTGNEIVGNYKETNKTEVINQPLPIQQYQTPSTQQYQVPARRLVQHNQFTSQNQFQNNNNRINPNNQLVLQNFEESDFQQLALSENEVAAPRSNSSNNTIPSAQIAQNANLLDIFSFEFEANESPFLLSNAAANEQKAITAMYTKTTVEEKPIQLILDSRSAGSIITYQLMQQLQKTVNRPAQTVIVTATGIKKTPVEEIDNFPFTIDGITISVKVLVMDTSQYQALVGNNWLLKANANLDWET